MWKLQLGKLNYIKSQSLLWKKQDRAYLTIKHNFLSHYSLLLYKCFEYKNHVRHYIKCKGYTNKQSWLSRFYTQANKTSSYDESSTESLCNIDCSLGQGVVDPTRRHVSRRKSLKNDMKNEYVDSNRIRVAR